LGAGATQLGGPAIRADTLFQAASISKPATAFAALRLVDSGVLTLDDDLRPRLRSWTIPDSPLLAGHPVTLRGILSHSAGLIPGGYGGFEQGSRVPTLIQTLDGVAPARPKPVAVAYTPGTAWRYAGGGYLVAQLLMTEATGQPFAKIMRDQLLKPVGMSRSGFEELSAVAAGAARGHIADGTMVPGGWHIYPELAAAGLWSSAPDLARLALAVMDAERRAPGAILSPAMATEMVEAEIGPRSLGFIVAGEGRARRFEHGGTNEGYNAMLIAFPETCQGAAIMANSDNAKPLINEVLRAIADSYQWPDRMESAGIGGATLTPQIVERFVGTYRFGKLPDVAPFRIVATGASGLMFDRGDGHTEPLFASSEGLFAPDTGVLIKAVGPEARVADTIIYARLGGSADGTEAKRVIPKQPK
jgi:CubicO group peptidase (beta-lactamase class C family)